MSYHDEIWICQCGEKAPKGTDGWRHTDAAWCPECAWLA